jgi:hypothetical protein
VDFLHQFSSPVVSKVDRLVPWQAFGPADWQDLGGDKQARPGVLLPSSSPKNARDLIRRGYSVRGPEILILGRVGKVHAIVQEAFCSGRAGCGLDAGRARAGLRARVME